MTYNSDRRCSNRKPSDFSNTDSVLRIDCDECALQNSAACRDCLVPCILGYEVGPVVVDIAEARAVRLLAAGGLTPPLRHVYSG
ncbi:MAG: hypothetical protein KDA95_04265 [Acidimicrobiales bacterium]|nr:hypothetical protein [Acidimicrobiales bacterium]